MNILFLPGALGSTAQFDKLINLLSGRFAVHAYQYPGHGGNEIPSDYFTIEYLADGVVNYIRENDIKQPLLFGYSMGGYIALNIADRYPELLTGIVTLATKFGWTKDVAERESKFLDPLKTIAKAPAFAQYLEQLHGHNWQELMSKTKEIIGHLGEHHAGDLFFKNISIPVKLLVGDEDKMVSVDETEHVAKMIPNGEFLILQQVQHPIEKVDPVLIAAEIEDFVERLNKSPRLI